MIGGRSHWILWGSVVVGGVLAIATMHQCMARTKTHELAPLTTAELESRDRIRSHVQMLAGVIGGRDAFRYDGLKRAATYIETELRSYGYHPERQAFSVASTQFDNIDAELQGTAKAKKIVVIGAHYDTAGGLPGANDNGSGVATVLELARQFASRPQENTLRWAFFANEEPPYFQTPGMGSYVYARRCHERRDNVIAMLSIETIGYYSDEPGSQRYPAGIHPGYPDRGDFLGFVADFRSAGLLRAALRNFRAATTLPAAGAAAPAIIPGVGWSDHWAFWQFGYKAIMLTDTAPYRYPYYHTAEDTPEKLDYDRLARAYTGIRAVVSDLAAQ